MGERLDDLLKDALTPSEEPSAWLNQNIVNRAKGDYIMKKPFYKKAPVAAALAVGILAAGSMTAYAAWNFMSAEQIAEKLGDKKLADAFTGDGAVSINESQSYGDYNVTLLGAISGKNISSFVHKSNGEVKDDRTYAVVAIKKKDGTDISDEECEKSSFLVSPFIKGENPVHMNIFYMGGGTSAFLQDGIRYQLVDCDNLEAFAKRGVYLGVLDRQFYDSEAYSFDKTTGEITRNEDYESMNLLFNLPLDESKGSEQAAKAQLEKWIKDAESGESSEEVDFGDEDGNYSIGKAGGARADDSTPSDKANGRLSEDWTVERVKKECDLIGKSVRKLKPDAKNSIVYEWSYNGYYSSENLPVDNLFKKGAVGYSEYVSKTATDDSLYLAIFSRAKDGTITASTYRTALYD